MAIAKRRSQDRVDEPGGALLSGAARQVHGIVHDRRRRNAVEMKQLIEAEADDQQDVGVEPGNRPAGEMLDEVVEAPLPPQRAGHDVRRERAIAVVGEACPRLNKRGGAINATCCDGAKPVERGRAARPAHDPNFIPGRTGRPARKSRVRIGRRPSAWTSVRAISPSPVATSIPARATLTIVPGKTDIVSAFRRTSVFHTISLVPSRYE